MDISINNYETYAIDFIDGTLGKAEHAAFMAFLVEHPEIAAEIEAMQGFELEVATVEHPNKSSLYRRDRKVVPLIWSLNSTTAIAVAATVLIATFAFGWMYQRQGMPGTDVVIEEKNVLEEAQQQNQNETTAPMELVYQEKEAKSTDAASETNIISEEINQTIAVTNDNVKTNNRNKVEIIEKPTTPQKLSPLESTEMAEAIRPSVSEGMMRAERSSVGIASLNPLAAQPLQEIETGENAVARLTAIDITLPDYDLDSRDNVFTLISMNFKKAHSVDFNGTPKSYDDINKNSLKEALLPGAWASK